MTCELRRSAGKSLMRPPTLMRRLNGRRKDALGIRLRICFVLVCQKLIEFGNLMYNQSDYLGCDISFGLFARPFENRYLTRFEFIELRLKKITLLFAPFGKLI